MPQTCFYIWPQVKSKIIPLDLLNLKKGEEKSSISIIMVLLVDKDLLLYQPIPTLNTIITLPWFLHGTWKQQRI